MSTGPTGTPLLPLNTRLSSLRSHLNRTGIATNSGAGAHVQPTANPGANGAGILDYDVEMGAQNAPNNAVHPPGSYPHEEVGYTGGNLSSIEPTDSTESRPLPQDPMLAALQSLFQSPAMLQPLASLIQQAATPAPSQTVALSTAIAHQVTQQLSKEFVEQIRHHIQVQQPSAPPQPHGISPSTSSPSGTYTPAQNHHEDEVTPQTKRLTPAEHQFNLEMQTYLKQKRLWHTPTNDIPDPPSIADIKNYQDQELDCLSPDIKKPRFDWNSPLANPSRCRWNSDLLTLLAQEFKDLMQSTISNLENQQAPQSRPNKPRAAKSSPFNLLNLNLSKLTIMSLRSALEQRLKRTKAAYMDQQPPPPGSTQTASEKKKKVEEKRNIAKKHDRVIGCRKGLFRHQKTIAENRYKENPVFWGSVGNLVSELGEHGMSSDETNCEGYGPQPKEVRHVRAAWRNPEITKILDYVDDRGNGKLKAAGNSSYMRHRETKTSSTGDSDNTKGVPIRLPENYYDPCWRNGLTEGQKIWFAFKPQQPLPDFNGMEL